MTHCKLHEDIFLSQLWTLVLIFALWHHSLVHLPLRPNTFTSAAFHVSDTIRASTNHIPIVSFIALTWHTVSTWLTTLVMAVLYNVSHICSFTTICVGDNNHTACVTSLYQQFYQQLLVYSLEPFKSRSKESIWHSPSPNTDQWVDRQQVQGGQVVRALDTSLSVSWRQTEPQARDPWGRHQVIQEIILSLSTTMSQFRLVSCHIRGGHHRLTKVSKGRLLTVDLLRPTIATHNNWSSTRLPQ